MKTCSISGCDRRNNARGMCPTHYARWMRTGSAQTGVPVGEKTGPLPTPLDDRIWKHVEKTDGCWLWTGGTTTAGYGVYSVVKGEMTTAHRIVYELLVGPIPEGMQLDHLCRVRRCVRPEHLEPVTPLVNTRRALPYRLSAAGRTALE